MIWKINLCVCFLFSNSLAIPYCTYLERFFRITQDTIATGLIFLISLLISSQTFLNASTNMSFIKLSHIYCERNQHFKQCDCFPRNTNNHRVMILSEILQKNWPEGRTLSKTLVWITLYQQWLLVDITQWKVPVNVIFIFRRHINGSPYKYWILVPWKCTN